MHGEFSVAQKVQAVMRGATTVKEAEDSALGIYPLLKAFVFTVVLPAYQATNQASDQQAAPTTLAGPNHEDARSAEYAKVK